MQGIFKGDEENDFVGCRFMYYDYDKVNGDKYPEGERPDAGHYAEDMRHYAEDVRHPVEHSVMHYDDGQQAFSSFNSEEEDLVLLSDEEVVGCVDSDFCDNSRNIIKSYKCNKCINSSNLDQCFKCSNSQNLVNCIRCDECCYVNDSEDCYKCQYVNNGMRCGGCKNSTYIEDCQDCINCQDCVECYQCVRCQNCEFCRECDNLVGKSYCYKNVQYTRDQYADIII